MYTLEIMRAIRAELYSHDRDITIDHTDRSTLTESSTRFDEFKKLCERIEELSRPNK